MKEYSFIEKGNMEGKKEFRLAKWGGNVDIVVVIFFVCVCGMYTSKELLAQWNMLKQDIRLDYKKRFL